MGINKNKRFQEHHGHNKKSPRTLLKQRMKARREKKRDIGRTEARELKKQDGTNALFTIPSVPVRWMR